MVNMNLSNNSSTMAWIVNGVFSFRGATISPLKEIFVSKLDLASMP
jgi:hypothetical protein